MVPGDREVRPFAFDIDDLHLFDQLPLVANVVDLDTAQDQAAVVSEGDQVRAQPVDLEARGGLPDSELHVDNFTSVLVLTHRRVKMPTNS